MNAQPYSSVTKDHEGEQDYPTATSNLHQHTQTTNESNEWMVCSVMGKRQAIRGKIITVTRLYKFSNVEQALQGAVVRMFLILRVNIIVHTDLKCNCSDLTC